ncbi:MAG TPA: hypothetical protein VIQ02_21135 [Jiangellaceae bacterium]
MIGDDGVASAAEVHVDADDVVDEGIGRQSSEEEGRETNTWSTSSLRRR